MKYKYIFFMALLIISMGLTFQTAQKFKRNDIVGYTDNMDRGDYSRVFIIDTVNLIQKFLGRQVLYRARNVYNEKTELRLPEDSYRLLTKEELDNVLGSLPKNKRDALYRRPR